MLSSRTKFQALIAESWFLNMFRPAVIIFPPVENVVRDELSATVRAVHFKGAFGAGRLGVAEAERKLLTTSLFRRVFALLFDKPPLVDLLSVEPPVGAVLEADSLRALRQPIDRDAVHLWVFAELVNG